jgi:hypothetical protein
MEAYQCFNEVQRQRGCSERNMALKQNLLARFQASVQGVALLQSEGQVVQSVAFLQGGEEHQATAIAPAGQVIIKQGSS